jgi:hypothetical protein
MIPAWLSPLEPLLEEPFQGIFLLCWLLLFFLLPDGRFVPRWSAWFVALPILGTISLFGFEFFVRDISPQYLELAGELGLEHVFITLFLAQLSWRVCSRKFIAIKTWPPLLSASK